MKRYYVAHCLDCNSQVLIKMEYLEYNDKCCLDDKNIKTIKVFNDEQEARNYMAKD